MYSESYIDYIFFLITFLLSKAEGFDRPLLTWSVSEDPQQLSAGERGDSSQPSVPEESGSWANMRFRI